MTDRHLLRLREINSEDPPDILSTLKQAVEDLYRCSFTASTKYIKGKGEQELAKAAEIRAKVIAHLGSLELERQQLLVERNKAASDSDQKMYQLRTERLQAIVDSLIRLRELGVEVDFEIIANRLIESLDEVPGESSTRE